HGRVHYPGSGRRSEATDLAPGTGRSRRLYSRWVGGSFHIAPRGAHPALRPIFHRADWRRLGKPAADSSRVQGGVLGRRREDRLPSLSRGISPVETLSRRNTLAAAPFRHSTPRGPSNSPAPFPG